MGTDRYASRDLADILLTQIQKDIRSSYNLPWTRRSMWNRNYSETRLPATPSTIIELLSHQNFADMQLGHDPNFKFTVGRAILQRNFAVYYQPNMIKDYVVQPLPVSNFAIRFGKKRIRWNFRGKEKMTRRSLQHVHGNTLYIHALVTEVLTTEL